MIELLVAGFVLTAPLDAAVGQSSTVPAPQEPSPQADVSVQLEGVVVIGRPLDTLIRNFVGEVAWSSPRKLDRSF
jgi:hypothetical protein